MATTMIRAAALLAVLVVGAFTAACSAGGATDNPKQLQSLVEANVNAGPGRGSTSYVEPSAVDQAAVAAAAAALAEGREPTVPIGYEVTTLGGVKVLSEIPGDGGTRGWGLAAVRQGTDSRVVIEVPHPRADLWTEVIGTQVFADSDARALLVAGAHRTANGDRADVAHNPDTVFAAMDAALVKAGWTAVQLHGFSDAKHDLNFDVVLSNAIGTDSGPVNVVENALRDAGFSVCVYDGTRCASIAGTTNAQAQQARRAGADFVHIEIADSVRTDAGQRARLVKALTDALG